MSRSTEAGNERWVARSGGREAYRGPLRAVIFDWAGTMVDAGSRAPVDVVRTAFAEAGVPVSLEEARAPMGLPKRDHLRAVLAQPAVAARFRDAHGREPTERDVDALYERFLPLQVEVVEQYATPLAGVIEVLHALRARGIAVGSTTGYPRPVMDRLVPAAARHGLRVDAVVCEGETVRGRPSPLPSWKAIVDLGVWPAAACVKVDDTVPGVEEGVAAGFWTVGVAMTGNEVGAAAEALDTLPAAQRDALRARATQRLLDGGAHYVVDGVADLLPVLDDVEARLARGDRP